MVFTTSNNSISLRVEDVSFMMEAMLHVHMKNGQIIDLEHYDDYDKLHRMFLGE